MLFFKILTIEKLNALFTVLEAFGNSRTHMNSNATRFTQLFSLDFDQSGQIASASLQVISILLTIIFYYPIINRSNIIYIYICFNPHKLIIFNIFVSIYIIRKNSVLFNLLLLIFFRKKI